MRPKIGLAKVIKHKYPAYLKKIRQCPCVICGGQAEAAHLRYSSAEHNKVNFRDDKWVTPLCAWHHRLAPDCQHSGSEFRFWERHGINPLELAEKLFASQDLEYMQKLCIKTFKNKPPLKKLICQNAD